MENLRLKLKVIPFLVLLLLARTVNAQNKDRETVAAEHGMINMGENKSTVAAVARAGTKWYPQARLGLFIHWGINAVKDQNISWPMIPGRGLVGKDLSDAEIQEIVAKQDYNRYTANPIVTPNEYWEMAKDFNPDKWEPEIWIKAAKRAGFTYAVLTTRHHDGFALWPSAYGSFNTSLYMGGRDLVQSFVVACRKYGMKVGLYYSPPDWYFDRDFMNFMYYKAAANPKLPKLDANLQPRTLKPDSLTLSRHQQAYAAMVHGQVTELLTRYGKIDLLWFDGAPPIPNASRTITKEEILQLQPDILINPRLHGKGDFVTFERTPPQKNPAGWAEFCNPWTSSWTNSTTLPFRAPAFIIGQMVLCNAWDVNYLLGIGPNGKGEMSKQVYENLAVLGAWMKKNHSALEHTTELPESEQSNVSATAKGTTRYLFAVPKFNDPGGYADQQLPPQDEVLTITAAKSPRSVVLLADGKKLPYHYKDGVIYISFPAGMHSRLVDVIKVEI